MKKSLIIISLILVVTSIYYFSTTNDNGADSSDEPTAVVFEGNIERIIYELGNVEPVKKVEIKSKIGGEIKRLYVGEGKKVRIGDVLAKIDAKSLTKTLERSKKEYEAALAEYNRLQSGMRDEEVKKAEYQNKEAYAIYLNKKMLLEKMMSLFADDSISRKRLDDARSEYEVAKAKLNSSIENWKLLKKGYRREDIEIANAKAEAKRLEYEYNDQRLKDAVIKSPIKGVVIEINAEEGEIVSAGTVGTEEGTLIMIIADVSKLIVHCRVNEVNINKIRKDQKVKISVDSAPERLYHGRVTKVSNMGKLENDIVTYKVLIELTDADNILKLGMTAKINIITARKEKALLVPVNAVFTESKKSFVYANEGSRFEKREVVTGISDRLNIEILSGLKKGEKVLIR